MYPIGKVIAVYPKQKNAGRMVNGTYDNIVFLPIDVDDVEELREELLEVFDGGFVESEGFC